MQSSKEWIGKSHSEKLLREDIVKNCHLVVDLCGERQEVDGQLRRFLVDNETSSCLVAHEYLGNTWNLWS